MFNIILRNLDEIYGRKDAMLMLFLIGAFLVGFVSLSVIHSPLVSIVLMLVYYLIVNYKMAWVCNYELLFDIAKRDDLNYFQINEDLVLKLNLSNENILGVLLHQGEVVSYVGKLYRIDEKYRTEVESWMKEYVTNDADEVRRILNSDVK